MNRLKIILAQKWDAFRIFKTVAGASLMVAPVFDNVENSIFLLGIIVMLQGVLNFNCIGCCGSSCAIPGEKTKTESKEK